MPIFLFIFGPLAFEIVHAEIGISREEGLVENHILLLAKRLSRVLEIIQVLRQYVLLQKSKRESLRCLLLLSCGVYRQFFYK